MSIQPSGNDHRDLRSGKYTVKDAAEPEQLTLDFSSIMDDGPDDLPDFLREVKKAEASPAAVKWLSETVATGSGPITHERLLLDEARVTSVRQIQHSYNDYEWVATGKDGDVSVPPAVAGWLTGSYDLPDNTDPAVAKTIAVATLSKAADTRLKAEEKASTGVPSDSKDKACSKANADYDDTFAQTCIDFNYDSKALAGAITAHKIIVGRTGSGKYVAPPANFAQPSPLLKSVIESKQFTARLHLVP